jgi:hypothetical protein
LEDDLLSQIIPVVPVPAVGVADLVEDLLMLLDESLEPFLKFWYGHRLPLAIAALAARALVRSYTPLFASSPYKITHLSDQL